MFSRNHPIILFIDRGSFSLFQDVLTNIPKFNFTPDIVVNLDVIDKEKFTKLIATFIQINKIAPSSLAIILSDAVIYAKDLNSPPPAAVDPALPKPVIPGQSPTKEDIQNFLENVPFEEVLAKVIKTENMNRIAAVNKDLVMAIADVFVNGGSTVEAVVPSFLYGQDVNFAQGLTQDNVRAILERSEIVRIGNLLTDQQKVNIPQGLEAEAKRKEEKPKNRRQYILIGVFIVLLVVLVIAYLTLGNSQAPASDSKMKNFPADTVIVPTAVPALAPMTTVIPADIKSIKIKITQSSQADEKAADLKNELLKMGFEDIASEVSEISIPEKSSVIFSQSIPTDLRNNIIVKIKKIWPDISILENQDADSTITILIGKS